MNLILWRHAEAEDGGDDLARNLTGHGRKQAKRVGAWLRKRLPAGYSLLVSPANRTRQTAEGLAENFRVVDALAPGASAQAILNTAGWPEGGGTIVIVGHQPTLGEAVAQLLTGRPTDWTVKRGAAWWFEYRAAQGDTVFRAMITPDLA
jgi:phosphohistidine phosphatase